MTPRQHEVLENALELLVSGGEKALTTANIARASNCSKESLYKWFGDRDGLLAAMMAFQGSKVGAAVAQRRAGGHRRRPPGLGDEAWLFRCKLAKHCHATGAGRGRRGPHGK